jgi:hypothetical protein
LSKAVVFIHGEGNQPGPKALEEAWIDSVRAGLKRADEDALAAFDAVPRSFVYFADLTAGLRDERKYDAVLDAEDLRLTHEELGKRKTRAFNSRSDYEQLSGRTSLRELIADIGMPLARAIGMSMPVLRNVGPDVAGYLSDTQIGAAVRARLTETLADLFARHQELCIVGHSLGTVVAYDVLHQLSRSNDAPWYSGQKLQLFITLGSPLGDATVQDNLSGADASGEARYPDNIVRWTNFNADDDFVAHDNKLANDFKAMQAGRLVSSIDDHAVLNFSLRYGKSDPRCALGYLMHPRFARTLADWV